MKGIGNFLGKVIEAGLQPAGKVFIELDFHFPAATFQTFSWESSEA